MKSIGPSLDQIEGAVASSIIGLIAGGILVHSATAETGQAIWMIAVVVGSSAAPRSNMFVLVSTALECAPFVAGLFSRIVMSGKAYTAFVVGKLLLMKSIYIPLSAATDRDIEIRYSLFFLFLLVATWPASFAAKIAVDALRAIGRASDVGSIPGLGFEGSTRWMRAWRLVAVAGSLAAANAS